jgi:hypothetical protein
LGIHSTAADYIFFSAAHGTLSKIDHILGHKVNLSKQKNQNNPLHPIDCNGQKVEINGKENHKNPSNPRRLNNIPVNDQWVIEEMRKKIKKFLDSNENEHTTYQNLWDTAKREVYSHVHPHQKITEISSKQSDYVP